TATDRVLKRVAAEAGVSLGELTPAVLADSADQIERLVLDAHWQAVLLGWGAATAMVVAAVVGMSSTNLLIVVTIVVLYELYLLSRHEHAVELLAGALTGELAEDAREMAAQAEISLTWPQRVASWFGWRPPPPSSSAASPRGKRPGRSRH
ncbi:MAG: hypothetical protein J7M26_02210, partial [Armatimonadetes bacterium]|nr:hypothetical protein [Armatimonadota bacterium]